MSSASLLSATSARTADTARPAIALALGGLLLLLRLART